MSIEFTKDYSNHNLLNSTSKYTELYKLVPAEPADIKRGDLVLLKTPCGKYEVNLAVTDADENNTLKLTKYQEVEYTKYNAADPTESVVVGEFTPCTCY